VKEGSASVAEAMTWNLKARLQAMLSLKKEKF